jgi:hypothetical protein
MKRVASRTSRVFFVGATALLLWAARGCNFSAGLKTNGGNAGAGTAGASGAAGAAGVAGAAGSGTAGALGTAGAFGTAGAAPPTACVNLQCQQSTCGGFGSCTVPACPNGGRTTVSGKIYDPAGKTPLYNITVYVPNAALADINDGPSCDPCDPKTGTSLLSGQPVVITKTDESGTFHLGMTGVGDVPAGTNIPLVIQDGKWRRQITVPTVTACQDNLLTDVNQTRLPRTHLEGHIPKMALTTGQSDAMECLLRKIGIDDSEFTADDGMGRVNLFGGGGGAASFATAPASGSASFTLVHPAAGGADWWDSLANLEKYDILLHSCEGGQGSYTATQDPGSVKSPQARMVLQQYADMGGRVFASHWHAYWFEKGTPDFMSVATFLNPHGMKLPNPTDTTIDQTFDKGKSLAKWMFDPSVMGSTTLGIVSIAQDASNTEVAMAAGPPISQRWLYAPTQNNTVVFLSATTPIPNATNPKPAACGRAVLSDLHVSAGGPGSDMPDTPFPMGCVTTDLSPREKVLEFMLFDIASCVQPIVQ